MTQIAERPVGGLLLGAPSNSGESNGRADGVKNWVAAGLVTGTMLLTWLPISASGYSATDTMPRPKAIDYGSGGNSAAGDIVAQIDDVIARTQVVTSGDLVRDAHARSGLTWEQMAKLFGVSRRSLHLWANGGRMNAANTESLHRFVAVIATLGGTTNEERRQELFAPRLDRASIFEELRIGNRFSTEQINPPGVRGFELLGADGQQRTS
jgi:DNA-binding XRE family transcriptional regulator